MNKKEVSSFYNNYGIKSFFIDPIYFKKQNIISSEIVLDKKNLQERFQILVNINNPYLIQYKKLIIGKQSNYIKIIEFKINSENRSNFYFKYLF